MSDKVVFSQAVMGPDSNRKGLSGVEAFDDYFFLSGRKYQVLSTENVNGSKTLEVKSVQVKANIPLNLIKILSYLTGIIPLIMLIGKAIARSKYEFREQPIINRQIEQITDDSKLIPNNPIIPKLPKLPKLPKTEDQNLDKKDVVLPEEDDVIMTDDNIHESEDHSMDLGSVEMSISAEDQSIDLKVNNDDETLPTLPVFTPPTLVNDEETMSNLPVFIPPSLVSAKKTIPTPPSYTPTIPVINDEETLPTPPSYTPKIPVINDEGAMPEPPKYVPIVPKKEISIDPNISGHLLNLIKEIADTETSHSKALTDYLEVMNKKEFLISLKKSEINDIKFINEFLKKYKDLAEKCDGIQGILQVVADSKESPLIDQMNELCRLFLGDNFKGYMDALIDASSHFTQFIETVNMEKGAQLMKTINTSTPFEPLNILLQRISRYPLLLKEVKKDIEKMGLTEETPLFTEALAYFQSKTNELDMISEIEDIKKMIAGYNETHSLMSLFNINERAKIDSKINSYKEKKKEELKAIKQTLAISPIEKELKKQRIALLSL